MRPTRRSGRSSGGGGVGRDAAACAGVGRGWRARPARLRREGAADAGGADEKDAGAPDGREDVEPGDEG